MSLQSLTSVDSRILPNVVAAFSVLATSAGLYALLDPMEAIPTFGLRYPQHHDRNAMDLAIAMTRVYGVRNFSMGLVNLAFWWNSRSGDVTWRRAMGWGMIMGLTTPIVDGFMCEAQGKTSGWKHWTFVPISAAVGVGLLM